MSKPLLLQLAKVVFKARLFWPIWLATTITAAVAVARLVRRGTAPKLAGPEKLHAASPPRISGRRDRAALALLAFFLLGYIVLILRWEDFAYLDNSMFTLGFLQGHDLGPPIWREYGRFFPLGHQEFDIIHHFTSSVVGYHALPILQLLAVCGILLVLDDELSVAVRAGLIALVLVTPAMVASFGGLIYTERNVVLWLALLVLSLKRFDETSSAHWAVGAVICAQFMIYYKETAFLLLWGLAFGRLILRLRDHDRAGWEFARLRDKPSAVDFCLGALGAIFLLYYATSMLPHPNIQYVREEGVTTSTVILSYLKLDLLPWLLTVVVCSRAYLILRGKVNPAPLWDGLAWGGVAVFAAYLYLGLFSAYYLAPVDFIAILYIGRLAHLRWPRLGWGTRAALAALCVLVLFQNLTLSAVRLYERKNVIHAKAAIASVVKAQCERNRGMKLFFPFADPYEVMEFAAYLSYRGVPVEGVPVGPVVSTRVMLLSPSVERAGPCVPYEQIVCRPASAAEHGDLVVILPDDDASDAETTVYYRGGELLFSCEPRPRLPGWLKPLERAAHIASYAFAQETLPDRWLDASVTLW
jgi:hypothetical protein